MWFDWFVQGRESVNNVIDVIISYKKHFLLIIIYILFNYYFLF